LRAAQAGYGVREWVLEVWKRVFLLAALLAPALGLIGVVIFQTEPAAAYQAMAVSAVGRTRIAVGRGMFGVKLGATMKQVRHELGAPTRSKRRSGGPLWNYARLRVEVGFDHGVVSYLSTSSPRLRTANGVGVGSSERTVLRRVPGVVCTKSRGRRTADCVVNRTVAGFRSRTEFVLRSDPAVDSVVMTGAAVDSPVCAQSGSTTTCTYRFTGTDQTFVVPAGVTSIEVVLIGGHGGANQTYPPGHYGLGGSGAMVAGTLGVVGGTTLYVDVGGNGGNGSSPGTPGCAGYPPPCSPPCTPEPPGENHPCMGPAAPGGKGGFDGGGAGGAGDYYGHTSGSGGGGFSDIGYVRASDGSSALSSMLVVSAGGGGAPGWGSQPYSEQPLTNGGDAGLPGTGYYNGEVPGGPGTATAGGAGGVYTHAMCPTCACGNPNVTGCFGAPGTHGNGGKGGEQGGMGTGGGGGGGGWYGGGGGAQGAGGGGGSSQAPFGFTVSVASPNATSEITISY
jgi:hypothetical protein